MRLLFIILFTLTCIIPKAQLNKKNHIQIVRGPYLQVATDTSITIRWRTNFLSRSRVRYGTEFSKLNNSTDNIELKMEHIITIGGLRPNTKYYYSVGNLLDTLKYDPEYCFTTLPEKNARGIYKFSLFGDVGTFSKNQTNVREEITKRLNNDGMTAWLLLGDNAYKDGDDDEYQKNFFTPFQNYLAKYPLYTTPGNHDYHDLDFTAKFARKNQSSAYFKIFSMPLKGEAGGIPSFNQSYYSFDVGNIHFISLDSYLMEGEKLAYDTTTTQIAWLKKDLEANQDAGWLIVFIHHPPYSKGTHNSDTEDLMVGIRENLVNIFDRYNVDVVLSGHSHVYERSKMLKGHVGAAASFDEKKHNLGFSPVGKRSIEHPSSYKKRDGKGIVYVVSGSSMGAAPTKYKNEFPHPAMHYSDDTNAGAGLLEVDGKKLNFKWVCADGKVRDEFNIEKL